MGEQQWVVLGTAAVLVFWMVGAYNRLVSLRNAIGVAFAQIDEQLRRRTVALPPLVEALREQLPGESHAYEAVLAALHQAQIAAQAVRARPVHADAVATLAIAEGVLSASLERLLSLLELHPQVRAQAGLEPGMRELHDADLRLAFARQMFNDAVEAHNAALRQFPTRLLGPVFSFEPAGRF